MGLHIEQVNRFNNISNKNEVSVIKAALPEITEEYVVSPFDNVIELPTQKRPSTIDILKLQPLSDFISAYSGDLLPVLDEQYELLEILGSGGMANVFKVKKNGSYYALKLLKDEFLDEKRLSRFKNEIDFMKRFNSHSNILSIVDSGNYMGRPCIVEEFADGKTLHEAIKTIHPHKLLEYIIQISKALSFIHKKGYIHRDLKPENIFLAGGIAKLGDFGVVKIINAMNAEDNITSDGIVLGTLGYISPEEAKQALEPSDNFIQTFQADLYSIGVILYEGLTGQLPIQIKKNDNEQINVITSLRKISMLQPKPLCELNSNINPCLANTIMMLLKKDPQERSESFKDAEAVAETLTKHLENKQIVIEDKAA